MSRSPHDREMRPLRHGVIVSLLVAFLAVFLMSGPPGSALADQEDGRLEILFGRLAVTADAAEARSLEAAIWQIWLEPRDAKLEAVMARGIAAMNGGRLGAALAFFDRVTREAPNFAEGWNKRATVRYLMKDFDASVRDIARTLALEPRHFGALSGLGLINMALERPQAALRAFEEVLKIHPNAAGARTHVRRLRDILRGDET